MKRRKCMKTVLTLGLMLTTLDAYGGGEGVGGGDPCEDQIKIIRADLESWIVKGGPKGLTLPQGLKVADYSEAMLGKLKTAKIKCVGPGDQGFPVEAFGTPKVCKFEKDWWNQQSITCGRTEFLKLDESRQYVLIHHEYAGLADIEPPNRDDSNYNVSNQISSFLINQVVKRLAVKPPRQSPLAAWRELIGKEGADISRALQETIESTTFTDCDVTLVDQPDRGILCDGGIHFYKRYNFMPKPKTPRGFWRMPVGESWCQKEKGEVSLSGLYKNTQGQAKFMDFLDGQGLAPLEGYPDARLQSQIIYELDPTEHQITKITLTLSRFAQVNEGSLGTPVWREKLFPVRTLECHSKNNKESL